MATNKSLCSAEGQPLEEPKSLIWGMKNNGLVWYCASYAILSFVMVHRKGISNTRLFFSEDSTFDSSPWADSKTMLALGETAAFASEAFVSPFWGNMMDRFGAGVIIYGTFTVCGLLDILMSYTMKSYFFLMLWILTMGNMCTADAFYQTMFRSFFNYKDARLKQFWSTMWLTGYQIGAGSTPYLVALTSGASGDTRWRVIFRYIQSGSAFVVAALTFFLYPWCIDAEVKKNYRDACEMAARDGPELKAAAPSPMKVALEVKYAKRLAVSYSLTRSLKYLFILRLPVLLNQAMRMPREKAMKASSLFDMGGFFCIMLMAYMTYSRFNGRPFAFGKICSQGCTVGLLTLGVCLTLTVMGAEGAMVSIIQNLTFFAIFMVGMVNGIDLTLGKQSPMILEKMHLEKNPNAPNCAQSLRGINYSTACIMIVIILSLQTVLDKMLHNMMPGDETGRVDQISWMIIIIFLLSTQVAGYFFLKPLVKYEAEQHAKKMAQ